MLPFFGIGMKTDLFQSCGHCWVFQICWHMECSTFTASSSRICNISTGIPSPPLALFVVMLSKAHLTSHSRMSGSRWDKAYVFLNKYQPVLRDRRSIEDRKFSMLLFLPEHLRRLYEGGNIWAGPQRTNRWHIRVVGWGSLGRCNNTKKSMKLLRRCETLGSNS